jgi:hypothetical protein
MRSTICRLLIAGVLTFVAGCNKNDLDTSWRSENYRLIAIDTRGQMCLINTLDETWEGVGPTVFSIGASKKYIVVAQHPATNSFGDFDRSVTNYFIVERSRSLSGNERRKGIQGPLSKGEFDRFSTTLSLPNFTKTFNDLQ